MSASVITVPEGITLATAAFRHAAHLKAMSLEPRRHRLHVLISRTKLLPELLRREPVVIVRRGFILLLVEQRLERGFLFGAAAEDEQHAIEREVRGRRAEVKLRTRQRMRVAFEGDEIRFIHRLRDARWNGALLGWGLLRSG